VGGCWGYGDLHADPAVVLPYRAPDRSHQLVLTADMGRYVWMINGRTYDQHQPLPVQAGERVRLEFVNQTMMYHPMHLYGHTFALRDPAAPTGAALSSLIEPTGLRHVSPEAGGWRAGTRR